MGQTEDRNTSDPEQKLLSVFPEAEVSDILDAFGDPEGEFAEEPGAHGSRGGSDAGADADAGTIDGPLNDGPFPDVPDADAVTDGSPADPASPPDGFHGTDLLNGAGLADEPKQDR